LILYYGGLDGGVVGGWDVSVDEALVVKIPAFTGKSTIINHNNYSV
jgi:hypothetical protein